MEEETRYIFGAIETKAPPPFEQSQIQQAELRLKKTLEKKIKSKPFLGGEPTTLAGKARGIPGFVHLNPKLLGAAFFFQKLTNKETLDKIPDAVRDENMKKVLHENFSTVQRDPRKYAGLKADLIRYLKLIERYFK